MKLSLPFFFVLSLALALGLHWASFSANFYWDDKAFLFLSPALQIDWPWDYWLRGTAYTKAWPLTYTLFWCLYKFFGQNLFPFRLALLGLHCLNATLFLSLLRRFFGPLALFGALLFVVHPLHVETLSWVMQISTTLSATGLLLSLLALLRFNETGENKYYIYAIAAFFAALASKNSVALFPILFLPMLAQNSSWTRALLRITPFAALSGYFCFLAIVGIYSFDNEVFFNQHYAEPKQIASPLLQPPPAPVSTPVPPTPPPTPKKAVKIKKAPKVPRPKPAPPVLQPTAQPTPPPTAAQEILPLQTTALQSTSQQKVLLYLKNNLFSLDQKISKTGDNFLFYLEKFFVPRHLDAIYPDPEPKYGAGFFFVLFSFLSLWSFWKLKQKIYPVFFGLLFCYCAFIPISGLFYVTYMKYSVVADHWAYLLLFGFIAVLLYVMAEIEKHIFDRRLRRLALLVLIAIPLQFSLETFKYSETFNTKPRAPEIRPNIPPQPWPPIS